MTIYHRDPCLGTVTYSVDIFTSSGTWTKPSGLVKAIVLILSGGGGGRGGRRGAAGTNAAGGVGHGGAGLLAVFDESELSATEAVTVGAGGVGGAGATTDNTNGGSGGTGGSSDFKYGANFRIQGGSGTAGGSTNLVGTSVGSPGMNVIDNIRAVVLNLASRTVVGTGSPTDAGRGFATWFAQYGIASASGAGGQINASNVQLNAGPTMGFYRISDNALTDEIAGALPETAATPPTVTESIGEYLGKIYHWFDPADVTEACGRGGSGGACGDLAGTVAGLDGTDALGHGAGGGGGGASRNGANSGKGGAGSPGIVIVINVLS